MASFYRLGLAGAMALALVVSISQPARAEAAAPKVSGAFGVDFYSDYYFRGIAQENDGLIVQPYVSLSFDDVLAFSDGQVTVSPYVGVWGSVHEGGSPSVAGGSSLYEVDFTVGVAVGLPYGLGVDVSYVWLTAPSAGGEFAQEIDAKVSYDATDLLARAGMPEGVSAELYVLTVIETANGSDGGTEEGMYGEAGLTLGYDVNLGDVPLGTSAGVRVGWNYDDYYETAATTDNTFGFAAIDLGVAVPLDTWLGTDYGSWSVSGGVTFMFIGEAAEAIGAPIHGSGQEFKVLGFMGIGTEF
jgi:hypothetical protein